MDKITDWAEVVSDRLVEAVKSVMSVGRADSLDSALECVLSTSCAGPKSVELAKVKLGI